MARILGSRLTWTAVLLIQVPLTGAWNTPVSIHRGKSFRTPLLAKQNPTSDPDTSATTDSIYSYPALYDLAFGYRDFHAEVSFLLQAHQDAVASSDDELQDDDSLHILELAAGPARHAWEALQDSQHKVATATCIDLSPEMKSYAEKRLETEPCDEMASRFTYHLQDMRSFDLGSSAVSFDTAWILLGSMQHLTRNQDVLDCFRSVHKTLKPAGTLILELPHPRELFGMIDCTRNEWTVPLSSQSEIDMEDEQDEDHDDDEDDDDDPDGDKLEIIWGDEDDEFDPIRQIRQATVVIQRSGGEEGDEDTNGLNALPRRIRQVVPMRLFTAQEIDALATCAGFAVVKMYGALEDGVDIDDEEEAFRLVCVLQKQ